MTGKSHGTHGIPVFPIPMHTSTHNFKLTAKNSSITECDFITRMLSKTFIDIMFNIAILCIYIPI